jgi:hypothetical protein
MIQKGMIIHENQSVRVLLIWIFKKSFEENNGLKVNLISDIIYMTIILYFV